MNHIKLQILFIKTLRAISKRPYKQQYSKGSSPSPDSRVNS